MNNDTTEFVTNCTVVDAADAMKRIRGQMDDFARDLQYFAVTFRAEDVSWLVSIGVSANLITFPIPSRYIIPDQIISRCRVWWTEGNTVKEEWLNKDQFNWHKGGGAE
jgi:hypothetical protein